MKQCPTCNTQVSDNAVFCPNCGTRFERNTQYANNIQFTNNTQYANTNNNGQFQQQQNGAYNVPPQQAYVPQYDPYDHTSEFEAKDISDNKVISMLVYLMGTIGIVIALLASNTSAYAAFHVRQALKFTLVQILGMICAILLCWTLIVPIAYVILVLVLTVVKFICFFQICSGKAKEPVIIRSLGFLR